MSDAQTLLSKIAALRRHLEQVQGLAREAGSAVQSLEGGAADRLGRLEHQVAEGARQTQFLSEAIRQLSDEKTHPDGELPLPRQLTARARRVLTRGRELLAQLRPLADELLLQRPGNEALAGVYREAVAMAETALRMVQAFPDAPSAQLRLGEGLEAILKLVGERVARLVAAVAQQRREEGLVQRLAELLTHLHAGHTPDVQAFVAVAEGLLVEVHEGVPLRFADSAAELPAAARFAAAHSLTTARVMAHLVRFDPELRAQPVEPIVAALVHDAGMLSVPAAVLAQAGPLDDEQRRVIERHTLVGADLARRLVPGGGWLVEAAGGHHERLDGTGYPAGLRDLQIAPLTRLLAVCDIYAALCVPRPQRRAFDTRTALTDTLLLAEQGVLDRVHAERLLQLSFYPVGTAVELADGAVGVVVATHSGRRDLSTPARPVLALLLDPAGQALPSPQALDLAQCDTRSIVRALPSAERRALLGTRYPEWAA
jgi:HD-GYP domain-containing protein (c-di-GMP phosphodiesterase class II)